MTGIPFKEWATQFVLQLLKLQAERWLRHMQLLCCGSDRTCLRDGCKIDKLTQFHVKHPNIYMDNI